MNYQPSIIGGQLWRGWLNTAWIALNTQDWIRIYVGAYVYVYVYILYRVYQWHTYVTSHGAFVHVFQWIGFREHLNRKPKIFPLNMGFPCKISLKPIQWVLDPYLSPNLCWWTKEILSRPRHSQASQRICSSKVFVRASKSWLLCAWTKSSYRRKRRGVLAIKPLWLCAFNWLPTNTAMCVYIYIVIIVINIYIYICIYIYHTYIRNYIMIAAHGQTSILLVLKQIVCFLDLLGCHSTLTINVISGKSPIRTYWTMENLSVSHLLKNGENIKVSVD